MQSGQFELRNDRKLKTCIETSSLLIGAEILTESTGLVQFYECEFLIAITACIPRIVAGGAIQPMEL